MEPSEDRIIKVLIQALLEEAGRGLTKLWYNFRRRVELPGERKEVLSSFLLGMGDYLLVPGADYQPSGDQLPAPTTQHGYPTDIEALLAFRPLLPEKAFFEQTVLFEQRLTPIRRVISSGSPKSNALSRRYLPSYQLSEKGEVSLQHLTVLDPESITYCFGENLEASRVVAISKMRGGSPEKKIRKMVWRRTKDGGMQPWVPRGYESGERLSKDFLLVSRLPRNKVGGDVLVLAGAHGAGTEATRLLVQELNIRQLRDLADALSNAQYYQFVVEIHEVDHTQAGTLPRRVSLSEDLPPVILTPKLIAQT